MSLEAQALAAPMRAKCVLALPHRPVRFPSAGRFLLMLLTAVLAACDAAPTGAAGAPAVPPELGGPIPLLEPQRLDKFQRSVAYFDREYTAETGLGPLFNGVSCVECHDEPVRGGAGPEIGLHATTSVGGVCNDLSAVGGPVIQLRATPALSAALGIDREPVPAGATVGLRTTPAIWGSGLLDAVTDSAIVANADPDDRDGDGVSGRVHWTTTGRPGRFGRKAQVSTLWEFLAGAYLQEMGITNDLFVEEQTVDGQPLPPGVDPTTVIEIEHDSLSVADAFVRWAAPPPPAGSPASQAQGLAVFASVGCAACHIPELRTGANPVFPVNERPINAYTDLLLHDMGPALADICLGDARPEEFRTEPLWGLRFRRRLLHDGRASTVDDAIRLHAGEGDSARQRYLALSAEQRTRLLAFLGNL